MAMHIIRPGKVNLETAYVANCNHCKCRFTFTLSDVKEIPDFRDGNYHEARCPETSCKQTVRIFKLTIHRRPEPKKNKR